MINDFYTNLTTITNNLEDITFTKYATITNVSNDGTCTAKEDEEDGLTHENVPTLSHNLKVGDKVVLGFVDNSIYNPVILAGGEEAYTKTETDALLQKKINEPLNEGTNGQVLTTDGNGGRTWKTVQGGGTGVDIATSWGNPTSDSKVPSEKLAKNTLDGKANVSHTHTKSEITDFPTIPTKTSDLTNDGDGTNAFLTQHQSLVNYVQKSSISGLLKNDGSVDTTQYLSSLPSHNHDDRYYTESEVDTALNGKQATLISGTNIKTINNTSLLGSGNINIQGGGTVTVDDSLSTASTNPVQNNVITGALNGKANSSHTHLSSDVTDLIDVIYPVGSIYMSVNSVNPSTLFGGTWEQIEDKFLLASGTNYVNGTTGGSADAVVVSHTHTQTNHTHGMAHTHSHNHKSIGYTNTSGSGSNRRNPTGYSASGIAGTLDTDTDATASSKTTTDGATANIQSTGESGVGKNMPPYLAVNVWKRTA